MIGKRIKRARRAKGLSQQEVAKRTGFCVTDVSKFEQGKLKPTSKTLISFSHALDVRFEFFSRPSRQLKQPKYRCSSLDKEQLAYIEANILDTIERFFHLKELCPNNFFTEFTIPKTLLKKGISAEKAANIMRKEWQLGVNEITNLKNIFEKYGIIVLVVNFDEKTEFDGLVTTIDKVPIIVINENWPEERQRFTMAHELSHLIFATHFENEEIKDEENFCNHFAGAFLVTTESVIQELGDYRENLGLYELYLLKHKYGLSMKSWIYRAYESKVISKEIKERLFDVFKKNKWNLQEPGKQITLTSSNYFNQLLFRAFAEDFISESKAAELYGISVMNFNSMRRNFVYC